MLEHAQWFSVQRTCVLVNSIMKGDLFDFELISSVH